MKIKNWNHQMVLPSIAMMALLAIPSQAELVVNGVHLSLSEESQVTAATYTPQIVSNDLIDANGPWLHSWARDGEPAFETTTLNDGLGCPATGGATGTFMLPSSLPLTYTFNLKTSLVPGYEISEIRSYAGWLSNGQTIANQRYELLVRTIAAPNFVSLGVFEYLPFSSSDKGQSCASKMVLTESGGGAITSGVTALRFVFMDHGQAANLGGTVYFEVDVIGTPLPPYIPVDSYVYDAPPGFADTDGEELINGILPDSEDFTDEQWVGWIVNPADISAAHPQVTFNLGARYYLEEAHITYLHSIDQADGTITAPESVWVSASADGLSWSTPVEKTGFDSSDGDAMRTAVIDLEGLRGNFVRLDFRNSYYWTFLGEIAFTGHPPLYDGTVIRVQ